eukprot:8330342-Pyramimonas_sp.AAC.1
MPSGFLGAHTLQGFLKRASANTDGNGVRSAQGFLRIPLGFVEDSVGFLRIPYGSFGFASIP